MWIPQIHYHHHHHHPNRFLRWDDSLRCVYFLTLSSTTDQSTVVWPVVITISFIFSSLLPYRVSNFSDNLCMHIYESSSLATGLHTICILSEAKACCAQWILNILPDVFLSFKCTHNGHSRIEESEKRCRPRLFQDTSWDMPNLCLVFSITTSI